MQQKKEKLYFNRTLKLKERRGITLIALVITIIILIILSTVTLNIVLGEGGLIQRAQDAKELTEQAALEEQQELNSLMGEYANIMAEDNTSSTPSIPIQEAKPNQNEDGIIFNDTTKISDDLDNVVTIPGGFHLDKDSGTKVEEGIVIEDNLGNQFVWIPVGEYNVSTTINSTGKLTNELTRRMFEEEGSTPVNGDEVIDRYFYGEGNENSIAKGQIEEFKTSATTNKGFYIGRYEQGDGNVCKAGINPYITKSIAEAKEQAEAIYNDNKYVTSELISSYAWDTALNFICQTNEEGYLLSDTMDSVYGNINTGNIEPTKTGEYKVGGQTADKYSNIYDMIGNCYEITTEYTNKYNNEGSFTIVGGSYSDIMSFASLRQNWFDGRFEACSFRIQLYINNN